MMIFHDIFGFLKFPYFLKVLEMDATKMTFESEYFDAIIDKGTLDALIV